MGYLSMFRRTVDRLHKITNADYLRGAIRHEILGCLDNVSGQKKHKMSSQIRKLEPRARAFGQNPGDFITYHSIPDFVGVCKLCSHSTTADTNIVAGISYRPHLEVFLGVSARRSSPVTQPARFEVRHRSPWRGSLVASAITIPIATMPLRISP